MGFISCSLETNNYFIVMNACTTAYHMTIIQTVNTSDAIGEYFNVSKKLCTVLSLRLCCSHHLILEKKKAKCRTRKPQFTWNYSDKNINMDNASHSRRLIKTCICQRQDRNYSACAAATTTSNLHASVPRGSPVCPLPS